MRTTGTTPRSCPDCGHAVYQPLLLPVRRPEPTCRALVSVSRTDRSRCGCAHSIHQVLALRPRHRLEA